MQYYAMQDKTRQLNAKQCNKKLPCHTIILYNSYNVNERKKEIKKSRNKVKKKVERKKERKKVKMNEREKRERK